MATTNLKKKEELKRERNWNAQLRWKVLQDTITWADAQPTVRRNTSALRLEEQAHKLKPSEVGSVKVGTAL